MEQYTIGQFSKLLGVNKGQFDIMKSLDYSHYPKKIVGNGMLTRSKKEKYLMTPLFVIQFVVA